MEIGTIRGLEDNGSGCNKESITRDVSIKSEGTLYFQGQNSFYLDTINKIRSVGLNVFLNNFSGKMNWKIEGLEFLGVQIKSVGDLELLVSKGVGTEQYPFTVEIPPHRSGSTLDELTERVKVTTSKPRLIKDVPSKHFINQVCSLRSPLTKGYSERQSDYSRMMHEAVIEFSANLEKDKVVLPSIQWEPLPATFMNRLLVPAMRRRLIAVKQQNESNSRQLKKIPGWIRDHDAHTTLEWPYSSIAEYYTSTHPAENNEYQLSSGFSTLHVYNGFVNYTCEAKYKNSSLILFRIFAGSTSLAHSRYIDDPELYEDYMAEPFHAVMEKGFEEDERDPLMQQLAVLFWRICQVKPWSIGDPSIAEIVIRGLYLNKTGEFLPPWKEGIIPWTEVCKYWDEEVFSNQFSDLFDHEFPLREEASSQ